MSGTLLKERRQYQRYHARPGTYAAFMPHSAMRGQIVDISKGGLAFHYIPGRRQSGKQRLAILVYGEGVFLNGIWCETISDFVVTPSSPFTTAPIRRCSVKFLGLNQEQLERIDHFITRHTIRDS